jgi:hypothetical protein
MKAGCRPASAERIPVSGAQPAHWEYLMHAWDEHALSPLRALYRCESTLSLTHRVLNACGDCDVLIAASA